MAKRHQNFEPLLTDVPHAGDMVTVAPGIHWVRLRLPFRLNHVNLWILDDDPEIHGKSGRGSKSGVWIVDTGFDLPEAREIWNGLIEGPLAGRPVKGVIATHMHPDHAGLAGWLCHRTGAPLLMTQADWLLSRLMCIGDRDDIHGSLMDAYRPMGLPTSTTQALADRFDRYRRSVSRPPGRYIRLREGMTLTIGGRRWLCRTFEGHAPEQLCMIAVDDNVMIVADQVLPEITPNVSVSPSDIEADPLSAFLESLETLAQFGDGIAVLPGHGVPFTGLAGRAREISAHHAVRLDRTVEACQGGAGVSDLVMSLFRADLDSHEISFAVGEALAHANNLVRAGRLNRLIRNDGTLFFEPAV